MHRLFISDLHLEDPSSDAFRCFTELLTVEALRVDELYILGDLVEMWVGDDDDSACASELRTALRTAAEHCTIFVMHGNRDFLFAEAFASQAGITLIPDPHPIGDGVLLSHGDELCTDDAEYQSLRKMMRDPTWQAQLLERSLPERQAFGNDLRAKSKNSNANKPTNIMDVNNQAVTTVLADYQANMLIHGHTHRPGHYLNRIVTGAWETCGWACRQHDNSLSLECFSLRQPYRR